MYSQMLNKPFFSVRNEDHKYVESTLQITKGLVLIKTVVLHTLGYKGYSRALELSVSYFLWSGAVYIDERKGYTT